MANLTLSPRESQGSLLSSPFSSSSSSFLSISAPSISAVPPPSSLWLGNFKLLLFAFDLGPLFSSPLPSFLHFAPRSAFPSRSTTTIRSNRIGNPMVLCLKVLLLAIVVRL
ncbi:hypothetical protein Csa_018226 [Cucumis sativus]|nr:hypothetical protein Csa_018226 [Cucumis sativus]